MDSLLIGCDAYSSYASAMVVVETIYPKIEKYAFTKGLKDDSKNYVNRQSFAKTSALLTMN